jgi:hypothetical protein
MLKNIRAGDQRPAVSDQQKAAIATELIAVR